MSVSPFWKPTANALVAIAGESEMRALPGGPLIRCDRADEVVPAPSCCKLRILGSMIDCKPTPTVLSHVITTTSLLVGIVNADRSPGWRFFHSLARIPRIINLSASVLALAWQHRL